MSAFGTPVKRTLSDPGVEVDWLPAKRFCTKYKETISVLVGPDKAEFSVHRDVICARSKFFAAACSQRWQEGRDKTVPLTETDPATFDMYMDVMYHKLVYDKKASSRPLIELYLLGDFLDDVDLRNEAMKLLLCRRQCPSETSINFIWPNTASGSLLRKWAVDMIAARLCPVYFERWIEVYPAGFLQQIAMKLHRKCSLGFVHPSEIPHEYLEVKDDGEVNA